jgi:hypothetical protein
MTLDQTMVFAVLIVTLVLFITETWRYDVVAFMALMAVTLTGIVPADQAFNGFGHAAVITVAAVLVLSRALQNSGVIDFWQVGLPVSATARRFRSAPSPASSHCSRRLSIMLAPWRSFCLSPSERREKPATRRPCC